MVEQVVAAHQVPVEDRALAEEQDPVARDREEADLTVRRVETVPAIRAAQDPTAPAQEAEAMVPLQVPAWAVTARTMERA